MLLKRLIFREADCNSVSSTGIRGPLSALVKELFETTVFPNMVRTGHWITGNRHKKSWYVNLLADVQVSRLIR